MDGWKAAQVCPVMALGISSAVLPTAILAATLAIGYPVALEARAELLETRGFTSMTLSSPVLGFTANCMFAPPSIPSALMILIVALLSSWWSLSLKVWAGAMTMLSPVCTPIGSRFSMLQTMMQLSLESRITSYSNS